MSFCASNAEIQRSIAHEISVKIMALQHTLGDPLPVNVQTDFMLGADNISISFSFFATTNIIGFENPSWDDISAAMQWPFSSLTMRMASR